MPKPCPQGQASVPPGMGCEPPPPPAPLRAGAEEGGAGPAGEGRGVSLQPQRTRPALSTCCYGALEMGLEQRLHARAPPPTLVGPAPAAARHRGQSKRHFASTL